MYVGHFKFPIAALQIHCSQEEEGEEGDWKAEEKDDVIEGDKAAGSYDKIMITDIAISLSRKKEDKVNGTGRFHIMKNRYGMDGMTFSVVSDTSTGHFEVTDHHFDDSESPRPAQPLPNTNLNTMDRDLLAQQFFSLNT